MISTSSGTTAANSRRKLSPSRPLLREQASHEPERRRALGEGVRVEGDAPRAGRLERDRRLVPLVVARHRLQRVGLPGLDVPQAEVEREPVVHLEETVVRPALLLGHAELGDEARVQLLLLGDEGLDLVRTSSAKVSFSEGCVP